MYLHPLSRHGLEGTVYVCLALPYFELTTVTRQVSAVYDKKEESLTKKQKGLVNSSYRPVPSLEIP